MVVWKDDREPLRDRLRNWISTPSRRQVERIRKEFVSRKEGLWVGCRDDCSNSDVVVSSVVGSFEVQSVVLFVVACSLDERIQGEDT
jgi:hypothetical protein